MFDDIRDPLLEQNLCKVRLDHIDSPGMYDYHDHSNHKLSHREVVNLIDKEIAKFKATVK